MKPIVSIILGLALSIGTAFASKPTRMDHWRAHDRFLGMSLSSRETNAKYRAAQARSGVSALRTEAWRCLGATAYVSALAVGAAVVTTVALLHRTYAPFAVLTAPAAIAGPIVVGMSGWETAQSFRQLGDAKRAARIHTVRQLATDNLLSPSDRAVFERAGWFN